MTTIDQSVEAYIAAQPKLVTRRRLMRLFIQAVIAVMVRARVTGQENIPDRGGGIMMINHISLLDPGLVMGAATNRFIVPMTKAENLENPFIAPFIKFWGAYSINRGEIDRKALMNSIELIRSGQLILIAPEGTRQPSGMARPKDGVVYVATKADAIIVPTGISGGINYLADWKHLRRPEIHIHFGRPFRFKTEGRARIPREEMAAMTDEAMYQIAMAVRDENLRGVYCDVSHATTDHIEFIDPRA